VALFEAISKTKPKQPMNMAVPSWMTRGQQAAQVAAESAPAPAFVAQAAPVPTAPIQLGELQQRASQLAGLAAPVEPVFSADAGRLRVSLSYLSAGVGAAGVVLVLIAAFVLGRTTASPKQQQAGATPPGPPPLKPEVVRGTGGEQSHPPLTTQTIPPRVKGKWYIVIQDMLGTTPAHQEEAAKIAEFCTQNGKAASAVLQQGRCYVLGATPFEATNDPAAPQYAAEIEALGKKYKQQGGKYDFMQRKTRGGPVDPLFIKL
jgi:hypothetical protein